MKVTIKSIINFIFPEGNAYKNTSILWKAPAVLCLPKPFSFKYFSGF